MHFDEEYIYHVYNQGNQQQKIFFNRENYLFFLRKLKAHVTPYADILAWCLMPNHFHLMLHVNKVSAFVSSDPMTPSHRITTDNGNSESLKEQTLNNSIGTMLRSYTRAINKEQNLSGSLFRQKTKAECVNCPNGITPSYIKKGGITHINILPPVKQYPQICFNYIHQNPTKARLVKTDIDWEFSSAQDYYGYRNGKLINKERIKEFIVSPTDY